MRGAHETITVRQEQLETRCHAHDVKIQAFTKDGDLMPATPRHRHVGVALLELQTPVKRRQWSVARHNQILS